MPGAWPTFRGWPKDQTLAGPKSNAQETQEDTSQGYSRAPSSFWSKRRLPGGWPPLTGRKRGSETGRTKGTERYVISPTLRREALETMFEPPVLRPAKLERGELSATNVISVDGKVVSGPTRDDPIVDTAQTLANGICSNAQEVKEPGTDNGTSPPDFPDVTNESGGTDWAKYLAWMEDDMSFEERINNNMLLEGSVVQEVSSNQSLTQLSLDLEQDGAPTMLLFKDLPAMHQGKRIGKAMYILGYDLRCLSFFLRLFEELPSTISVLPQHWDLGVETLRLTVEDVLCVLQDNVGVDLRSLRQDLLHGWDEEHGFKIVVLILFGQWIVDFERAFMWEEETTEIIRGLLVKWRKLLSMGLVEVLESVHDVEEEEGDRQLQVEEVDTEGAQEAGALNVSMESPLVQTPQVSTFSDEGSPQCAPRSIKVPRVRKRDTYDSDEEEEWAALEQWAACKKLELPVNGVKPEQISETAPLTPEFSPDNDLDRTDAFLAPERADSPAGVAEVKDSANEKRYSDLSTLCDGCEGNKEKLTFANTLRNAMLNDGSIQAMTEVYLEFVQKNPAHDSESKRRQLFAFLLTHIEEKDGGSLSVQGSMEQLKEMGVAEEEAETAGVKKKASSDVSAKWVSWSSPRGLATPLED
ncbi:MAG: hypothetical protein M1830_000440 [Pleopsidium flavum]|nr:MAG: hypothetical protein M1830_000440 [Pleopsidium flavum]